MDDESGESMEPMKKVYTPEPVLAQQRYVLN